MLKSIAAVIILILSLTLSSCSTSVGGLQVYSNPTGGYEFLYPNGWIPVDIKGSSPGVDIVYRDLIERSENLSVVVSDVPENKSLEDLGTPSDVGYRFLRSINDNPNRDREADFIRAESLDSNGHKYYILEYEVEQPGNPKRHNLASVTVNRGKLLTFNVSTDEDRWEKMKNVFEAVVKSFSVNY